MLKFEWPLIVPDDENVKALSGATFDVSEYVVSIASKEGLADGLEPLDGGVAVHLRLLPENDVAVIERCSGHGGSWGVMKDNFEVALKVGKPTARQAAKSGKRYVVSECPLAGMHIMQGIERLDGEAPEMELAPHPIVLLASAYGLAG
jgi:glycerol-3-phosphate dehydrogenase subunit C